MNQPTQRLQLLVAKKADFQKQAADLSATVSERLMTDEESAKLEALIVDIKKADAEIAQQVQLQSLMETAPVLEASQKGHAQLKTKPFATLGEQLVAIAQSTRTGVVDDRLTVINAAVSGGGSLIPRDGGFLIQTDFSNEIFRITMEGDTIASRCRQISFGPGSNAHEIPAIDETSRATGSRWGGVSVRRVEEGGAGTATKPKIGKIRFDLTGKLLGLAYMTEELLQDATAIESIYGQAIQEEFTWVLDNEILYGQGVGGECKGIMPGATDPSNAATGPLITVSKDTGQKAASLSYTNVINMYARNRYRNRAVWFVNADVLPQLDQLATPVGTGGQLVYLLPGGAKDEPDLRLKGRPVVVLEQSKTLGTIGDIFFADFSQYGIASKGGVTGAVSAHVQFLTDEMTFRWVWRINGQPLWKVAMTPANGSSTVSPFVALAARS